MRLFLLKLKGKGLSLSFVFIFFLLPGLDTAVSAPSLNPEKTLPGYPCLTPPLSEWTEQEKWVWKRICERKRADLAAYYKGGTDPNKPESWKKRQQLSSNFLKTILFYEPYCTVLKNKGVHILGARMTEKIDFKYADLSFPLLLEYSRFDKLVDLTGMTASHIISFYGSSFQQKLNLNRFKSSSCLHLSNGTYQEVDLMYGKINSYLNLIGARFKKKLNMTALTVIGNLHMKGKGAFKEVDLIGAKIHGQISLSGSTFDGNLNMSNLEAQGGLFMRDKAGFKSVTLNSAVIGGQVNMERAVFTDKLSLNTISIGNELFMKKGAFKEVDLIGAKINGQLNMRGSTFDGTVKMHSIEVGEHLLLQENVVFKKNLFLNYAKIGSSLYISKASLGELHLTHGVIKNELNLEPSIAWRKDGFLDLHNGYAKTLNDHPSAWPKKIDLSGFRYDSIKNMGKTGADILIAWLAKTPYSPQPYHQLAGLLLKNGQKHIANPILYAGKERERKEASFPRNTGLFLQKIFIGYGIGLRYFYALAWVAFFVRFGVGVLRYYQDDQHDDMKLGHAYSLDMLLPIIRLRERHYQIDLSEKATNYFYFHQIMGYVLAFFLISGLTGMTK